MILKTFDTKKTFLGIGICIVLFLSLFFIWRVSTERRGRISSTLSERAQEFIEAQKTKSGSEWKTVSFSTPVPQAGDIGTRFSTDCFTITFPFQTRDQKPVNESGSCSLGLRVLSPPARLVIWAHRIRTSLAEDTAITLRRRETHRYTESSIESKTYGKILVFSTEDEVTAFFYENGVMYSFSFTNVSPEKITPERLQELLSGFTITAAPSV